LGGLLQLHYIYFTVHTVTFNDTHNEQTRLFSQFLQAHAQTNTNIGNITKTHKKTESRIEELERRVAYCERVAEQYEFMFKQIKTYVLKKKATY
jgi:hypothetical protein